MLIEVNYPDHVIEIKEIKTAVDIGDIIGEELEKHVDEIDANISIKTSKESGIAHRERIIGVKPSDVASLEDRRLEVLLRWYDMPIYTERVLRQKLDSVLGEGLYVLTIDIENKIVSCLIELTRAKMIKSVQDMFEHMIPLDYMLYVDLRYNTWNVVSALTWEQASKRTWGQMKEQEV